MGHGTCFDGVVPPAGCRRLPSVFAITFLFASRLMRSLLAALALAPLVLFLSVPASAQEPRTSAAQAVLTPGDSVRIEVWRKPEFSGDFVVAPDGTITHPLFRSVRV